ncbi:Chitobiosyldiphosphodolichol beta-mannosyltransferase [Wickerhamomyces ciferrii]|uniref:Chitobiosyldiphosphodolichol beta-mannosyltransferase n=1 Tax=Wickerhamomyces ciferrii (strain ATCC 14091 / BCRC 22168 / CBS 111 / JCM 3599 / NBRC 0793 / NRRL Y-1031 F-60-10) TaxID=1206466 RepID=K0L010_WICCF|nr:Chitobiosyldiphosphodolichol beta-mannosyltransferase [Wickerhamomyces ciferrii]CCH46944.1 Chitobiosyldiphosphodolichol beta-mannosyltransferase [Wickerhamomyces ciferrii]
MVDVSFIESVPLVGQIYVKILDFIRYLDFPTWVWILIGLYLCLPVVTYVILPLIYGNISSKKRIIIFVLGDLGHSPRMCYHARSFAEKGYSVDLCGYLEESPPLDLIDNYNVEIHDVKVIQNTQNLPFVIFGVLKVIGQILNISKLLWKLRGANYILVQNPPSIPTLLIATLYKYITKTKLIIDWHNLGYSILEIKLGPKHPFVSAAKIYEKLFATFSDINLTVTEAMKSFLVKQCGVSKKKIVVLHDKAASQFKPLTLGEKEKIIHSHPEIFKSFDLRNDKIIVSSTSFTPDEDFNILINALQEYDTQSILPNLKVIITGKGPMKEQFLQSVKDSNFQKVNIVNSWLSAEDYPKVIATADIGISLHTSSSGIDLPMKVVDMFGCGLPVIALDFPALPELVTNEVNGLTVNTSTQIKMGI